MRRDVHLVTLGLGREIFAVPVACVIEILAMRELFRVPEGPAFLVGITEFREQAVPVIDLRRKLGLPPAEVTHQTRILVLEITTQGRRLVVGLVADRVIEVVSLRSDQIGPAPDIGASWGSGTIGGIARVGQGFIVIFDMARLFSGDDVSAIADPDPHAAIAHAA